MREPKWWCIKMTQEVRAIISMCIAGKKPEDGVFSRENGKSIGDFRKMWYKMCCAVGLGRMACRVCDRTVIEGTGVNAAVPSGATLDCSFTISEGPDAEICAA
jgi:hypothetical protein